MDSYRVSTLNCITTPVTEPASDNVPYQLGRQMSAESIAGLFNDDFSTQCLKDLELAVVEKIDTGIGDVDSLDILLNIALREDEFGDQAERIVFNLFVGRPSSDSRDTDSISERCLELYQLAGKSGTSRQLFSKLQKLSHLSYMAGAAQRVTASQKEEIARFLPDAIPQVQQEQILLNEDVWCSDRMLGTDEIAASLKLLEARTRSEQPQSGRDFSINFPISLYAPKTAESMLKTQLLNQEVAFSANEPDHPFKKINIFPVNDNNHWMLFVAYPATGANQPEKLTAVVFSSTKSLNSERKKAFSEAATMLGAGQVKYVEKNLQQHIHNSCGLLVVEAVSRILANRNGDPARVLKQFATDFQSRKKQALEEFNIGKRRAMFGDYIEVNRQQPTASGSLTAS